MVKTKKFGKLRALSPHEMEQLRAQEELGRAMGIGRKGSIRLGKDVGLPLYGPPTPTEEGWSHCCFYGKKRDEKVDFMVFLSTDDISLAPRALVAAGVRGRVHLQRDGTAKKLAHPGGVEVYIRDELEPYVRCVLLDENLQIVKTRNRPGSALVDLREPDPFAEGLPEYAGGPDRSQLRDTVTADARRRGLQSSGDEDLPRFRRPPSPRQQPPIDTRRKLRK